MINFLNSNFLKSINILIWKTHTDHKKNYFTSAHLIPKYSCAKLSRTNCRLHKIGHEIVNR